MTLTQLLTQTENEISLLRDLVKSHSKDVNAYPGSKYSIQSMISIQHCYNTLKRLNDVLTREPEADNV